MPETAPCAPRGKEASAAVESGWLRRAPVNPVVLAWQLGPVALGSVWMCPCPPAAPPGGYR